MNALFASFGLIAVLASQTLIIALSTSLFLKHASKPSINKTPITMTDIAYLLSAIGFFALMLVFIAGCEKV